MSQWVKAKMGKLVNTENDVLEKAFNRMSYTMDNEIKKIKNSFGKSDVDCGLRKIDTGELSTIGLSYGVDEKNNKTISVSGDFYFTKYKDVNDFIADLNKNYQIENIIKKAQKNGYQVDSEVKMQNGEHRLMLVQY